MKETVKRISIILLFSFILLLLGCSEAEPGINVQKEDNGVKWEDPLVKYILSCSCIGSEQMNDLIAEHNDEYQRSLCSEEGIYEFADIVYNYMEESGLSLTDDYWRKIRGIYIGAWTPNQTHVEVYVYGEQQPFYLIFNYGSHISSLADFTKLSNLRSLEITEASFSDLSPLIKLKSLDSLGLDCSCVKDLSILGELSNLKTLYICKTADPDVSFIKCLTKLEYLNIVECSGIDLQSVATNLSKSVKFLGLSNNNISDISALSTLTQLETLSLDHNQIQDIAPLVSLSNLKTLYLGNNLITDFTPLESLPYLETLSLD